MSFAMFLCCLALMSNHAFALYSKSDAVIQIAGSSDFDKKVLKHSGISIVEFYAPWCGHCKNLSPEYKKAAAALKGVARVVAVDATQKPNEPLAGKYGVQGFPTLKIFSQGKATDYQGQRTAQAIVQAVMGKQRSLVNKRMGGSKGSKSKKKKKRKTEQAGGSGGNGYARTGGGSGEFAGAHVYQLDENNFSNTVLSSQDQWLVAFYAPWCGHCKRLSPEWNEAAEQLARQNPHIKLGAVDATASQSLGQEFGVRGYPTIKFFKAGKRKKPQDYQGPREASGIVQYAVDKFVASGFKMEIPQLLSSSQFKESCDRLCIVAVLPALYDGGKKARDGYLKMLQNVAAKNAGPFTFLWLGGGEQPLIEKELSLTFGFPAIVSLSLKRKAYSVMTTAFDESKISHYLQQITAGRGRGIKSHRIEDTAELVKNVKTVTKWDGEDAPAPEPIEEEFSLEDIMGDDEL